MASGLGVVDVGGGIDMGSGGRGGNRAIATVGMARLVEKIQLIAEKKEKIGGEHIGPMKNKCA